MGYRVGIGEGMRSIGLAPRDPEFFCAGCGLVGNFQHRNGLPYTWFLDKKPKPGWAKVDGKDYCPTCRTSKAKP